jgi:hypothetical protein
MRLPIVVLLGGLAVGSGSAGKPDATECRVGSGSRSAPRQGLLRILPSRVPGVAISRASWVVRNEPGDHGLEENLYVVTTLRGTRRLSRDDVALVFDAPGPRAIVDTMLTEFDPADSTLTVGEPFLEPGRQVKVLTSEGLRSDAGLDSASALSYCPRTVRIVRRDALAQALAR